MIRFNNFAKDILIASILFGLLAPVFIFVPALSGIQLTLTGWGWAVFFVFGLGFHALHLTLKAFFSGLLGGTRFELTATAVAFLDEATGWIKVTLAFFATAAFMPSQCTHNAALPILIAATLLGITSATCDLIYARFKHTA